MKQIRYSLAAALFISFISVGAMGTTPSHAQEITVHKTPWCGCCKGWVKHLEAEGFTVTAVDHEDLDPIKQELGVPARLQSCHTGVVDGYVIEGHVPADDIRKLLTEGPEAVGLSTPGMPAGSPGMEAGGRKDPYQVILFGKDGMKVWSQH